MIHFGKYTDEQLMDFYDTIMSDRCWECDNVKAQGKCPDCNDPGEWCSECLREHQAKVHGEKC